MFFRTTFIEAVAASLVAWSSSAVASVGTPHVFRLDSTRGLELVTAQAEVTTWHGRRSIHLSPLAGQSHDDHAVMAVIERTDFHDGVIELDVAGAPRADADSAARGFVGIAFRVQGHDPLTKYECCYIRPSNARANDQLRRNHAVQYQEYPDYGWKRLRTDSPGVYESYADMLPGQWTHLRLEVNGVTARLYVNNEQQPALIVRDLKGGDASGAIALWSHASTDAHFANLSVH
jgi:hypothetical protein